MLVKPATASYLVMTIEPAVSTLKAAKKSRRSLRRLTKMSTGISRPRGGFRPIDLRYPLGREFAGSAVEDEPALIDAQDPVRIFKGDIHLMQVDDQGDVHLL